MRDKKCIFNVMSWRFYRPDKCCYCNKPAVGTLRANTFLKFAERDLCEEHFLQWIKGDLYL